MMTITSNTVTVTVAGITPTPSLSISPGIADNGATQTLTVKVSPDVTPVISGLVVAFYGASYSLTGKLGVFNAIGSALTDSSGTASLDTIATNTTNNDETTMYFAEVYGQNGTIQSNYVYGAVHPYYSSYGITIHATEQSEQENNTDQFVTFSGKVIGPASIQGTIVTIYVNGQPGPSVLGGAASRSVFPINDYSGTYSIVVRLPNNQTYKVYAQLETTLNKVLANSNTLTVTTTFSGITVT